MDPNYILMKRVSDLCFGLIAWVPCWTQTTTLLAKLGSYKSVCSHELVVAKELEEVVHLHGWQCFNANNFGVCYALLQEQVRPNATHIKQP